MAGNALRVYIGYLRRKLEADGERAADPDRARRRVRAARAVSLRRRITGAAALAVAAVAILLGLTGYLTTRSHLLGQLQQDLRQRAQQFQKFQPGSPDQERHQQPAGGQGGSESSQGPDVPPSPAFGGAPGYFQIVRPDGTAKAAGGGKALLPVDAQVRAVARTGRGGFFTTATVNGHHLEILRAWRPRRPLRGRGRRAARRPSTRCSTGWR